MNKKSKTNFSNEYGMKTIIGIDPGVTGAMSFIVDGEIKSIRDIPAISTDGFNGINPLELEAIIKEFDTARMIVYCEKSMLPPGNGKMTTRSVYECRGVIRAVLALTGVPLIYVPPRTWKKHFGIPPKSDKEYSRGLAIQRYPQLFEYLKRKKDHNRAEAILIAMYGWHKESK